MAHALQRVCSFAAPSKKSYKPMQHPMSPCNTPTRMGQGDVCFRSGLTPPPTEPAQYTLRVDMKRSAFSKDLNRQTEFIVEASGKSEQGKAVPFTISTVSCIRGMASWAPSEGCHMATPAAVTPDGELEPGVDRQWPGGRHAYYRDKRDCENNNE